jgi:hypothetical protein
VSHSARQQKVFLYTNNKLAEKEISKVILFTTATKNRNKFYQWSERSL